MMPELRQDPIVNRWVIMAPERAKRPIQLRNEPSEVEPDIDPFAEGNEAETPHEILALRDASSIADGPGWRVRVVPNKFPALQREGILGSHGGDFYEAMDGVGVHEVIVECPHAESNMSRLSATNISEILWVYRERLIDLKQDKRLAHATIFKNKGTLAGASLSHSHSQLIATPIVPPTIKEKIDAALQFFHAENRSIFADLIQREVADGIRLVHESTGFIAFCPYASRFPYEIWILPKRSASHFECILQPEAEELGVFLKTILKKLELALGDPPYNYVIHTAPFGQPALPHFSWHIEIIPRTTRLAGFELGSGFFINPVLPELAAKVLRECRLSE